MRVAVIGAGSVGLVALKNFAEEGLEVVGFEREAQVGGLWSGVNPKEGVTSALPCTRANWSKHRMCASDFPHLDSVSLHPTQQELGAWHQRYAEHFDLLRHIYFQTTVRSVDLVQPNEGADDGEVQFEIVFVREGSEEKEQSIVVDKVFVATGFHSVPFVPEVEGLEAFGGVVKHSQAFKSGDAFKGKKVVVVGSRSSASDVCQTLVEADAAQVHLSHRAGVLVVPRVWWGKPMSSIVSRRFQSLLNVLDWIKPHTSARIQNALLKFTSPRLLSLDKSWNFQPFPDNSSSVPTISDVLVPLLQSGELVSIPSLSSCPCPNTLLLSDGRTLEEIDAIIFATGYQGTPTTSLFGPRIQKRLASQQEQGEEKVDGFARLYKGTIVPDLPELSVNVQGYAAEGILPYTDLRTMWLAGVWSGKISLATRDEMWIDVRREEEWFKGFYKFTSHPTPGAFPLGPTLAFFDREIGCDLALYTSWFSLRAWKFYLSSFANMRLVHQIQDGVATPFAYRVWGRKKWEGARDAVEGANR